MVRLGPTNYTEKGIVRHDTHTGYSKTYADLTGKRVEGNV